MTTALKPALTTPTSKRGGNKARQKPVIPNPATSAALALNMVWQLVVVIVLPLVGGHLLDVRFHTSPIWMCVGMVIALAGMITVVAQTTRQLNELNAQAQKQAQADKDKGGKS